MKKKFFTDIIEISESLTEDSPKVLRALLLPMCFFGILLFMAFISPFVFTYKILVKDKEAPFKKLETELVAKWHTESSEVALHDLREWYRKLKDNPSMFLPKGANFEPYGRFGFDDYMKILNLLYTWELQHENYAEACEICDIYLEYDKDSPKGRKRKSFQYWAVQKAQIIKRLHGPTDAQKYLFEYVDPQNRNSPITEYFEKLRSENKSAV